jgi:hypothetical protein
MPWCGRWDGGEGRPSERRDAEPHALELGLVLGAVPLLAGPAGVERLDVRLAHAVANSSPLAWIGATEASAGAAATRSGRSAAVART